MLRSFKKINEYRFAGRSAAWERLQGNITFLPSHRLTCLHIIIVISDLPETLFPNRFAIAIFFAKEYIFSAKKIAIAKRKVITLSAKCFITNCYVKQVSLWEGRKVILPCNLSHVRWRLAEQGLFYFFVIAERCPLRANQFA